MQHSNQSTGVRPVKSALHTVEVLEFLASRKDAPTTMRDIGDALGIPRSSLYALLRTLTNVGWVRRDRTGTLYSVGIRALMTGVSYLDSDPYMQMVEPWLRQLHEKLEETVHLGRIDRKDILYMATKESPHYRRGVDRVGRLVPASTTALGKAILAEQPYSRLKESIYDPLPKLTEHSLTDETALLDDLNRTRDRGYSIDSEENTLGLKCFGFALTYTTPVSDAISCSVPLARLTPGREQEIIRVMADMAGTIEQHVPASLDGLLGNHRVSSTAMSTRTTGKT